jgi:hypothetical protein
MVCTKRAASLLALLVCSTGCIGPSSPFYGQPGTAITPGGAPVVVAPGAAGSPDYYHAPQAAPVTSVLVPVLDRDLVWNHVVDVVDDYFKVAREQRVRQEGDVLFEGQLETFPRTSPTVFEPWNPDAVTTQDRWENTLQSIRRQAFLRVIPAAEGFIVEATVNKELEDVERPEIAGVSGASLRNDNSVERFSSPQSGRRRTLGWIGQGRDVLLEQRILSDIQSRLGAAGPLRPF